MIISRKYFLRNFYPLMIWFNPLDFLISIIYLIGIIIDYSMTMQMPIEGGNALGEAEGIEEFNLSSDF